ncbi:FecCD family ABC transporter permease [Clostridium luticellarii]|jgi:iron complex transport system permease protein|uniref:Putative ABC transporter permease protein n=1 Tax=Clostridium luticellarii TaxID=1691940 RepID=A0A2T0B6K1_9CLOT|nr:iron ABC transporter permease [Clostridium luticellarii]MCI1945712.1 iron ABC transporter permease [Clostridium luticellarii]MCI1969071.1 iron ABC transporter permease [Clostridium luticellarii]MCI1996083.1 iron ABC transporter permease [Clostridium luticellarii]MCI2040430.1 iron ABC transporter permease [Clostridium luticellarii]PRR79492.1 putative ABC transporter permease protein [Clostridium luticellarii]
MKGVSEIEQKPEISMYMSNSIGKEKRKQNSVMIGLTIIPIIAFILSLTLGRYGIPLSQLFNIFTSKILNLSVTWPETLETVLFQVRIPRIIAAMMVGAALAAAGATYQGLFKNPMVSPDILGASAGAGFGAAVAILMSFNVIGIQFSAFLIGLAAVILTYTIASIIGKGDNAILVLVLTGMVISTLFSSFVSITKYVADPESKLPAITFWLMGGLSSVSARDVMILIIPLVLGIVPILLLRWKLNVLSFGEEEAQAMGIDTRKIRVIVIICSTLLTAASVSISGMIGWVGLIIPHVARLVVGPNYKILLPASMLIGSTFLLLVDDVARSAFTVEIPLGILTAIIGAPMFIYLLIKGKRGWV